MNLFYVIVVYNCSKTNDLGTLSPVSTEARIGAMLPENMGEIMKTIVKRKLHILPQVNPRKSKFWTQCILTKFA